MKYLVVLIFSLFCSVLFANEAIKGVIDLSDLDFEDQTYALDGEWAFKWNSEFKSFNPNEFIAVPGFWNSKKNGSYPSFGQACYRIKIKLPKNKTKLSLRINNIHNSYCLYLNDSLIRRQGNPSKDAENQKADWSPFLLPIQSNSTEIDLTFVVANFGHRNGGFASSIYIGDYSKMVKDREFYMSVDAIIIGGLFVLGVFLLSMFLLWHHDNSLLYFLGFSLFFAFWSSFRDEKVFFSVWRSFDWELALRLEYGAMVLSVSFFVIYISRLFPKQNLRPIQFIVLAINSIAIILILFFPPEIFTYIALSNISTLLLSMVYIVIVFIKVIKTKEFDNFFTSITLLILFTFVTLQVVNFLNLAEVNKSILDLISLTFVLSMALIFAGRFSGIFNSTMDLKNIAEKQKKDLTQKNNEVLASINYAKQLQSTILPTSKEIGKLFPNSFVLYQPKDIVSGDFYWMEERNGLIYFAAADCTGHGVPGAMVSFVCSNALSKSLIEDGKVLPDKILSRTREIVIKQFSTSDVSLNDGMDISLCSYNPKTNELQWSGANNSIWIIKKGSNKINIIKGDKQPIGNYVASTENFNLHHFEMEEGDRIYLFSDGYVDQFGGERGKKFKTQQLKDLILSLQKRPITDHHKLLLDTFTNWKGDMEQIDDVCILGIEF